MAERKLYYNLNFIFVSRNALIATSASGRIVIGGKDLNQPVMIEANLTESEQRHEEILRKVSNCRSASTQMYPATKIAHANFKFHLYKAFSMNLTFIEIKLVSNFFLCTHNHIAILGKISNFEFCGQHPTFNAYPIEKRFAINILVRIFDKSYFSVNSIFQVMDHNLVYNEQKGNNLQLHSAEQVLASVHHLICLSELIYTYKLRVVKYNVVEIVMTNVAKEVVLVAFDGPDLTSLKTEFASVEGERQWISSTFQCFIQIVGHRDAIYNISFSSQAQKLNLTERVANLSCNEHHELNLPNIYCKTFRNNAELCLFRVSLHPGFHINMTVVELIYKGISDFGCPYGGVSLFDVEETVDRITELVSLCNNYGTKSKHSRYPPRAIHSTFSTVSLVSYSYSVHSSLKLGAMFQCSPCKAEKGNFDSDEILTRGCHSLKVAVDSCLIVQFATDYYFDQLPLKTMLDKFAELVYCEKVCILPRLETSPNHNYTFQVEGFMEKQRSRSKAFAFRGCPNYIKQQNINFYGYSKKSGFWPCAIIKKDNSAYFYFANNSDTSYSFEAGFRTSAVGWYFEFDIYFPRYDKVWLNILTNHTAEETIRGQSLLPSSHDVIAILHQTQTFATSVMDPRDCTFCRSDQRTENPRELLVLDVKKLSEISTDISVTLATAVTLVRRPYLESREKQFLTHRCRPIILWAANFSGTHNDQVERVSLQGFVDQIRIDTSATSSSQRLVVHVYLTHEEKPSQIQTHVPQFRHVFDGFGTFTTQHPKIIFGKQFLVTKAIYKEKEYSVIALCVPGRLQESFIPQSLITWKEAKVMCE